MKVNYSTPKHRNYGRDLPFNPFESGIGKQGHVSDSVSSVVTQTPETYFKTEVYNFYKPDFENDKFVVVISGNGVPVGTIGTLTKVINHYGMLTTDNGKNFRVSTKCGIPLKLYEQIKDKVEKFAANTTYGNEHIEIVLKERGSMANLLKKS